MTHTNGNSNGNGVHDHSSGTSWATAGPAAFDFRSDVLTTPTPSMLSSVVNTTLLDDVFNEDPTTISLQSFIANLTDKPSSLLVLSGTMGNQVALRTHLGHPPHSILTDARGHIVKYEAGGASTISGAYVIPVHPANNHHLTLEDVKKHAVCSDNIHYSPTTLICLENTLNGMIMPLEEAKRISQWAWSQSPRISMHCDGARLWEAVTALAAQENATAAAAAATASPADQQEHHVDREKLESLLKEYSACFDTLSLCFSKGLGAPIGSILVGPEEFITRARRIRKMMGGALRQAGVVSAPARVAVEETFLGGKLSETHERAKRIAKIWESLGGKLAEPIETNMVWLDLYAMCGDHDGEVFVKACEEEGVVVNGGRLVVHYQISDEAVDRLHRAMKKVLK